MHQLKEVDMLAAKMDLLMKRLDEKTVEKKEVMHIHDSGMTCEECGETGHTGTNCLELKEDVNYINKQQLLQLPSLAKSRLEPATAA